MSAERAERDVGDLQAIDEVAVEAPEATTHRHLVRSRGHTSGKLRHRLFLPERRCSRQLLVAYRCHRRRALGVEDRVDLLDDLGRLLSDIPADFELDIDAGALAGVDPDADLLDRCKALHGDDQLVDAGRQVDEAVAAIVVGDDLLRAADELLACHRDRHAGQPIFGALDGDEAADAAAQLSDGFSALPDRQQQAQHKQEQSPRRDSRGTRATFGHAHSHV